MAARYCGFSHVPPLLPSLPIIAPSFPTSPVLTWALSVVWAESLRLTIAGEAQPILVPFVGSMSHNHTSTNVIQYNEETVALELLAPRDMEEDALLAINGGNLSNTVLLLNRGVWLPGNPHGGLTMSMGIAEGDPYYDMRLRALAIMGQTPVRVIAVVHCVCALCVCSV